jgi:hypothetical protein
VLRKLMLTAIGLGAAYLYKNKDARQKLMNFFQSTGEKMSAGASGGTSSGSSSAGSSSGSYQQK